MWSVKSHTIPQPTPMTPIMANLKVADFLQPHTKQWHYENTGILFGSMSAHQICRTPLLHLVQTDQAVWKYEKHGIYSVRGAYRNIMERNLNAQQNRINGNWNQIWRIKMPPRIFFFYGELLEAAFQHGYVFKLEESLVRCIILSVTSLKIAYVHCFFVTTSALVGSLAT